MMVAPSSFSLVASGGSWSLNTSHASCDAECFCLSVLPFGKEVGEGVGGRTTGQGYGQNDGVQQKWHTLEHDDETGLDFAEARYYSSAQGRFTSVDPLIASARRRVPQSWNRYSYGINNPLKYVDPSGEAWITGPGGRTFFDKRVNDAGDLKELYGKGYSIIDGQTRLITRSVNSPFTVGNLYTFNSDGSVTNHGRYTPPLQISGEGQRIATQMAVEMGKLYLGAAATGATAGTSAVGLALGGAGVAADVLLADEEAPDPQTMGMAAGITISPLADDWITKGAHIKVDGVELAVLPGKDGIVLKPVFSSTPQSQVDAAIAKARGALANDPTFRGRLTSTVERSVGHFGRGSAAARAKSGELRFLLKILRREK